MEQNSQLPYPLNWHSFAETVHDAPPVWHAVILVVVALLQIYVISSLVYIFESLVYVLIRLFRFRSIEPPKPSLYASLFLFHLSYMLFSN